MEQEQKDSLTAAVIAIIAVTATYFLIGKWAFNWFSLSTFWRAMIIIACYVLSYGMCLGAIAKQRAYRNLAYKG